MKDWRLLLLQLGLGLGSGILYGLPFRYLALGCLAYLSLAPWVILCTHPRLRERSVLPAALAGSGAVYLLAWSWLFSVNAALGWTLSVAVVIPFVPFVLILRRCARRHALPLTILVPVVWVGWEMVRPFFMPGQHSMMLLGYSQICYPRMVQIADLFGVAAVSFLVAMGSGLVADLVHGLVPVSGASRPAKAGMLAGAGMFGLLFLLAWGYGLHRDREETFRPGPKLALIQPAVPHVLGDTGLAKAGSVVQSVFTVAHVRPGAADMVVWPENAILDRLDADPQYLTDIGAVLRFTRTDLLLSALRVVPGDPQRTHRSVFHFSPRGELLSVYDKVHLLPVAEYLPLEGLAARIGPGVHVWYVDRLETLLGWTANSKPGGHGTVVFTLENDNGRWMFGVPTCHENTHAVFARTAVRSGAQFLVNMTSEGLLGPLASRQLYLISAFRAVENRAGVVRVSNTGITGFIDPNGRPQSTLSGPGGVLFRDDGVLIDHVMLDTRCGKTLYNRLGDWPARVCTVITALLLVLPWSPRRGRSGHGERADTEPQRKS